MTKVVSAFYFDGRSSKPHDVKVLLLNDQTLHVQSDQIDIVAASQNIKWLDPIADLPLYAILPNGARLEVHDKFALNAWLNRQDSGAMHVAMRVVHKAESLWRVALVSVLLAAVGIFLILKFGVPMMAHVVAKKIPVSASEHLATSTMDSLDDWVFEPSTLESQTSEAIEQAFYDMVSASEALNGMRYEFEVLFRDSEAIGANAFALPGGTMVVTDQLVDISGHTNEVLAVLAHEAGHVKYDHGMRMVLQDVAFGALVAGMVGDFASLGAVAAALPAWLMRANYSRGFETQADDFALTLLEQANIPTSCFASIMRRIENEYGGDVDDTSEHASLFSTHPLTAKRIARFEQGRPCH